MAMSSSVGSPCSRTLEDAAGYCECPLPVPKRASNGARPFTVCGRSEATCGGCGGYGGYGDGEVVRGGALLSAAGSWV
jgi:hypothetical protein